MDDGFALRHEDAWLLVVDKPAGVLAVPGIGERGRHNVAAHVQRHWADALVVHRLDMPTSGLMVFARSAEVHRALSVAFAERRVAKRYEAVVGGLVGADAGAIDAPLAVDWPNRPRQRVDRDRGKPSLTRWRVLARDAAARRTRLDLEPVTGRSHQLRVHLLSIGHPIVGDTLYAPEHPAPRMLLHAREIAFEHPVTGTRVQVASPPPF